MIKDGKLVNPEFRVETTNLCNATCVTCPRSKLIRPKEVMETVFFCRVVHQAKKLGAKMVSPFGYGEALLDSRLGDKIRYCSDYGLETFITTNASMLDVDRAFELLSAGLKIIRFSVHGTDDKSYQKFHRGLSYESVMRNIFNFCAINRNRFWGRCKVEITAIPQNEKDIELIKAQWKDVDLLEIWKPHNWAGGKKYRKLNRQKNTCNRPFSGPVQVLVDGKVVVCCFDFNGEMIIGDLKKESLESILNGKRLNKIRKRHLKGNVDNLLCANCDQLNIEDESPLIYSSVGDNRINCTSGAKYELGD